MALGDGVSAIANLGVVFGGFSPTVIDGVASSKDAVRKYEELNARRKEAAKRQRELEFARTSKQKHVSLENGDQWTYVVVDDHLVRLLKCETTSKKIDIPSMVEGMRVYAIASDAVSGNEVVEEIICPDLVEVIGACAFRHNPRLRKLHLPFQVADFQSSWISHCPNLQELVLPGQLDKIAYGVFANTGLKKLAIGPAVYEIEAGAFQDSQLAEITVDAANPFISTDGTAIYSIDGTIMLALAVPCATYAVMDGCVMLAKKSCYRMEALKQIACPPSLKTISEFALSHTGLVEFSAPEGLQSLESKAFYYCKSLQEVRLNEGLKSIGDSAFEESGLPALQIPASIEHIGSSITARTNIVHSGPGCTLTIDEECKTLFLDGNGGLYRHETDGPHMIQLVDPDMVDYAVADGTVAIDDYAFAFHNNVRCVHVADSVRSIGKSAFRICRKLAHVSLPNGLESIGDEAFLDTELESFRAPASLRTLGRNALVTYGAHHGQSMPSLAQVEVDPANEAFYVACGMLCRRMPDGDNVVMFTSSESTVVFPNTIKHVEEYAFNNARGIDYLELNPNLATIGTNGLSTWCWIRHIHVKLSQEVEGRTSFDFFFPDTPRSLHSISVGIGGASWVNVPGIMAQYDACIVSARDYNAPRNPDNISAYDQVKLILARLDDPILLTDFNRGLFERLLRTYIVEICVDIARHDDRDAINRLVDRGFVNADNLEGIIQRVNGLQDAAMTAYLLELKRLRFSRAIIDFDL